MTRNPGKPVSMTYPLDGPDSAALPDLEWAAIKGEPSLQAHLAYLRALGTQAEVADSADGD